MLTTEERLNARQFNNRARQLFWNYIVPQTCPIWSMDEESIVDWTLDFQSQNHLLMDGKFGPTCLIVMMSNGLGGLGGFVVDGKEIQVENACVARMFIPEQIPSERVSPDLCCFLSVPEIDLACRDRILGRLAPRAHFSIDSSVGINNQSLIIQWSDPLRTVPFMPTHDTIDYPRNRQCIGIEIENVLLLYQLDSDERRRCRRRPVIKASIGNKTVNQPVFYESQINACMKIMDVLHDHVHIPIQFPISDGQWNTSFLDPESLQSFSGYIAKFNYFMMNNEPGAGLVPWLDTLFEATKPSVQPNDPVIQVSSEPITAPPLTKDYSAQREELSSSPLPTSSFSSHPDDTPRFSLAKAIESAHTSTRAARAARIADKASK